MSLSPPFIETRAGSSVAQRELRVGHLLEWEKRIWRVIKCYHVHVGGRGGAGITVQVPRFVIRCEKIKIDTNEGKYMERA